MSLMAIPALERWRLAQRENSLSAAREQMVPDQIIRRGITDERVLDAMRSVPRHEFVPEDLQQRAYSDRPLAIGYGQTISQPYVVAYMTEQLRLRPSDRVLEIGTGCGYQSAVLSLLVAEVWSVEILEPLAQRAISDLQRLGYNNVRVRCGDGSAGWPEGAPYDAIIVTCAPREIPPMLIEQLRECGSLVIPTGGSHDQTLYLLRKNGEAMQQTALLPVRFVPMTAEACEAG
jgi:protein-L-isoaspartate(D-aspartate) O-methyltransferase